MTLIARDLHDELGPEKIVVIREPCVGLEAVVVVDKVSCGPAIGGVPMAPDGGGGCSAGPGHDPQERRGRSAAWGREGEEKIRLTTQETLEQARVRRLLPRQAATEMVRGRIAEAMQYRRP